MITKSQPANSAKPKGHTICKNCKIYCEKCGIAKPARSEEFQRWIDGEYNKTNFSECSAEQVWLSHWLLKVENKYKQTHSEQAQLFDEKGWQEFSKSNQFLRRIREEEYIRGMKDGKAQAMKISKEQFEKIMDKLYHLMAYRASSRHDYVREALKSAGIETEE